MIIIVVQNPVQVCERPSPEKWLILAENNRIRARTHQKIDILGNKLEVLSGRKVVAYPDVDAYGLWCERLFVYSNIKVSDYLQHIAGDNPSFSHMDLADLILESRLHPDTSQNPTFQQIKRYISPEYHSETCRHLIAR